MNGDLGELCADRAHDAEIIIELKVRMNTALDQNLRPSETGKLLNFLEDLILCEHIGARRTGCAVERAKIATHGADVRVADVPVHDKTDGARQEPRR